LNESFSLFEREIDLRVSMSEAKKDR